MEQTSADPIVRNVPSYQHLMQLLRDLVAGPPNEGMTEIEGDYEMDAVYSYPARGRWYHDQALRALVAAEGMEVGI